MGDDVLLFTAFSPDENELMRQFRLLMLYGRKKGMVSKLCLSKLSVKSIKPGAKHFWSVGVKTALLPFRPDPQYGRCIA